MIDHSDEHSIQNGIRNDLAGSCLAYRANVGTGWTGTGKALVIDKKMAVAVGPGDVVLRRARRFSTGLPRGFSDLFGGVPVKITPEMVGATILQFFAVEVKDDKGRARDEQSSFLKAIKRFGGRSGVARTVEDARKIVMAGKLIRVD